MARARKKNYQARKTGPTPVPAAKAPAEQPPGHAAGRPVVFSRVAWLRLLPWALALVVLTIAVYAPVRAFEFVSFDDDVYVTANPYVQEGLTAEGVAWAFTTGHGSNWHPLIWLSLMLNVEATGMQPGPMHVTNVVLHLANALLLLYLLARWTGRVGPSVLVVALFAVHPLHVESVAWVTERKDVLSTLFLMLTFWAYTRYVAGEGGRWPVAVFLALGLMSKPMLVTAPFVLLLLDAWPLQRWRPEDGWPGALRLLREKMPLFGVVLLSSLITFLVQHHGGAVGSVEVYSLGARISNAVVAYVAYLGKMLWPVKLAFFYPYPAEARAPGIVLGALALLLLVSAAVAWAGRRRPYLAVGWCWYLGTLVPVIGLVQVGEQSMADRYTYLPLLGIFVALVWLVADGVQSRPGLKRVAAAAAVLWVLALSVRCRAQVLTWRNDITLCEHALAVTGDNYKALNNLGLVMDRRGETEEAIRYYREAVRVHESHERQYNLGNALRKAGRLDEAVAHYERALELRPEYPRALNNMGAMAFELGRWEDAAGYFARAVAEEPRSPEFHSNLGAARQRLGDLDGAVAAYTEAVRLDPTYPNAQQNLSQAMRLLPR